MNRMFRHVFTQIRSQPASQRGAFAGVERMPDIFELETGDFAIIGKDITPNAIGQLPPGASCGPDEKIVVIPRKTLIGAKPHIPESQ